MKQTTLYLLLLGLLFTHPISAQVESAKGDDDTPAARHHEKAYHYYQIESYDSALHHINLALELEPDNENYIELKAYTFAYMGIQDSAIALSTAAIRKHPTNPVFYDIRGTSYYFIEDFDRAAADYDKLLSLAQDRNRYYYNYMYMANQQKQDDKIIKLYNLYTKNKSKIKETEFAGDIRFYTSLAYGRKEDYKKAIELLSEALEVVAPEKPVSYLNNRSAYYIFLGDNKNALRDIDTLLVIDPDGAGHYQSKAEVLISDKKYREAQRYLLKSRALGNTDISLALELAENYFELNKIDSSIYYYNIVMDSIPDNPILMNNYAYALLEKGEVEKARGYFEKAHGKSPDEIDYIIGLIVSNHRLGNEKEVVRWISYMKSKTKYKFSPGLLRKLEKQDYAYSDGIKKSWREIVTRRSYRR